MSIVKKVCFIATSDAQGIERYRLFNPMWAIKDLGVEVVQLPIELTDEFALPDLLKSYAMELREADFLVICSPINYSVFNKFNELVKAINAVRIFPNTLKLIADYDDDLFNIAPYNTAYNYYGTKEYNIKQDDDTMLPLWKNGMVYGETEFNTTKNEQHLEDIRRIMRMCSGITTTTERLGAVIRQNNPNVYVCPNAVDTNMWNLELPEKPEHDPSRIRVIMSGGNSHGADFGSIRKGLAKVMKDHPEVDLIFMGQKYGTKRDIPPSRITHIPFAADYDEYVVNMLLSGADIGICPLTDEEFNYSKSPIKWIEYGALGIPAVVAETMYGDHVQDNVNALVYDNSELHREHSFYTKLTSLVEDINLRKSIGTAAKTRVEKVYSLVEQGRTYLSILQQIKDPKHSIVRF